MDSQREEFFGRIARLEGGRTAAPLPRRPARPAAGGNWITPIVMLLAAVLVMKAVVHANVGPESYDYRIALLAAGDRADRIGAQVLAADPFTRALSGLLRSLAE